MFKNIEELVRLCESSNKRMYEIMIEQEVEVTGKSKELIVSDMRLRYAVMKRAVKRGVDGVTSYSTMTGNDGKRLYDYIKRGNYITDVTLLKAICYAVATNEVNAAMGVVCATPTAGSSGVLPGVIIAIQEEKKLSDDVAVNALFTAGAIGYVIANNAFVSGAAGGCQAEIGSASAMAASAIVEMMGGSSRQAANAGAIALKNLLGLACDPLAGLVEVPCIKRNAAGASNAITAAEMAMASIESKVPFDEVIQAMYQIGLSMPEAIRETALGGLAASETGKMWKKKCLVPLKKEE